MSLRYRAGPTALRVLRERGLTADTLAALVGPASGPKWIVLAGLDRALLQSGLLSSSTAGRPLLVGASAGAWRMLALATREPERAHRALLDGYVGMRFPPEGVAPAAISDAYRTMLGGIFTDAEVERLVAHPRLDLAVHTVRSRVPIDGSGSALSKATQGVGLAAAAVLQVVSATGVDRVFERVLFHTRPAAMTNGFRGRVVAMDRTNLLDAAVATGTVPIYMQPQTDLPGAPRGRYLDGGLGDYHLRERYAAGDDGITLFPHFQRRIVPVWFDRSRERRGPSAAALDGVLQLYPSDELVATLPDGRIPDRDDFFRYASDPDERIRRWTRAAKLGERLGEQLLDDLNAGRIPDLTEPL